MTTARSRPGAGRRWGDELRFARRASSEPRLAARRVRRALSARVTFVQLNRDQRRTLLLAGSARSGSTWLAEVLTEASHARLVFEPFHNEFVPMARDIPFGLYLDPIADNPKVAVVVDRALTGRVRCQWTDQFNTVRFPSRRVVKDIRVNNLLPWIVRHHPDVPVVYLLRHPWAGASSLATLGWPSRLEQLRAQGPLFDGPLASFRALVDEVAERDDPFLTFVLRWCLENYVPTTMLAPAAAHVVFYEHLMARPEEELARLSARLGQVAPGRWRVAEVPPGVLARPSRTNYLGTDVAAGSAGGQRPAPPPAGVNTERALEIVRAFGLDRLYDGDPGPRCAPQDVLRGSVGMATT